MEEKSALGSFAQVGGCSSPTRSLAVDNFERISPGSFQENLLVEKGSELGCSGCVAYNPLFHSSAGKRFEGTLVGYVGHCLLLCPLMIQRP